MNEQIDTEMAEDTVNKKNDAMNRNQNWVVGKRIIDVKKKRVEFFIRVKTMARFYELKSKAWDKFVGEGWHMTVKNTKIKHVERFGMLVGVNMSFASKEWHQQGAASSIKEYENNIKIRIENLHKK